jgi:hypothetical protein
MTSTSNRPAFLSEKVPHIDKTATDSNINLVLGPKMELDTKTGQLTISHNVPDFDLS